MRSISHFMALGLETNKVRAIYNGKQTRVRYGLCGRTVVALNSIAIGFKNTFKA